MSWNYLISRLFIVYKYLSYSLKVNVTQLLLCYFQLIVQWYRNKKILVCFEAFKWKKYYCLSYKFIIIYIIGGVIIGHYILVFCYVILAIVFGIIGIFLSLLFGSQSELYAIFGGITGLLVIPIHILCQILAKLESKSR